MSPEGHKPAHIITVWRIAVLGAYFIAIILYVVTQENISRIEDNKQAITQANRAATQAKAAAKRADEAIQEVQESRLDQCHRANANHDNTIAETKRQIKKLKGARAVRARRNAKGTLAIINALAPHRDCEEAVKIP